MEGILASPAGAAPVRYREYLPLHAPDGTPGLSFKYRKARTLQVGVRAYYWGSYRTVNVPDMPASLCPGTVQ